MDKLNVAEPNKATRVIRDKAFAKRLETATESHPHAPSGHGRQKWLRDRLNETFHQKVSPEAVRKWFSGEARPRPKIMELISRALEVDEAWLSLGHTPDMTPTEKRRHNAEADAAVNLVAGLIGMAGGTIAFPDPASGTVNLFAIIRGKQHSLLIKTARPDGDKLHIAVPANSSAKVISVVPTDAPNVFDFAVISPELISAHGNNRGGFVEIEMEKQTIGLAIAGEPLPQIKRFDEL